MTALIRRFVPFVAAVLAAAVALPAQAAEDFAVVDLQRALLEVAEGKAAKAKLKKEFDKRQTQLDGEQEELRRLKEDLDKQASVMDPSKRGEKEAELQRKFLALQQTYVTLQTELSQQEKDLTDKIFGRMEPILREIAETNGIEVIFERSSGVVYANEKLDVTNELIRKYNARHAKKKSAGKAQ